MSLNVFRRDECEAEFTMDISQVKWRRTTYSVRFAENIRPCPQRVRKSGKRTQAGYWSFGGRSRSGADLDVICAADREPWHKSGEATTGTVFTARVTIAGEELRNDQTLGVHHAPVAGGLAWVGVSRVMA